MKYSTFIKKKLLSLIAEMGRYHWLFTSNSEKDFSRVKKWIFEQVIRFIISMEGDALEDELLRFFDFRNETPTNSSFNQRRAQILLSFCIYLSARWGNAEERSEQRTVFCGRVVKRLFNNSV